MEAERNLAYQQTGRDVNDSLQGDNGNIVFGGSKDDDQLTAGRKDDVGLQILELIGSLQNYWMLQTKAIVAHTPKIGALNRLQNILS